MVSEEPRTRTRSFSYVKRLAANASAEVTARGNPANPEPQTRDLDILIDRRTFRNRHDNQSDADN